MSGSKSTSLKNRGAGDARNSTRNITMADLARIAGVSAITVSRALNNSELVNRGTRERIQELARRHGYSMNVSARNLKLKRSHTVAVIVEMKPTPERPMSGSYPLELLGGITQELAGRDFSVLLSVRADELPRSAQSAEAVILLGQGAGGEAMQRVASWNLPLAVWGALGGSGDPVVVGSDNIGGGVLAARYFLEHGRQRPCFMGDLGYAENEERFAGFRNALAGHGMTPRLIDQVDFTTSAGVRATRSLLGEPADKRPDAIFASSDLIALGVVHALRERGIGIPDQCSVVGFDDTALAASAEPALTSVHQDLYQGGVVLARKVLGLIEGRAEESELLPTRLVVRDT